MQLLNREWYHGNDPAYYPKGAYDDEPTCGPILKFWTFWGEPYYPNALLHKKWVTCTAYRAWGAPPGNSNQWSRPWQSNDYTSGGHYDWDIPGYGGKSLLNPSSVNPAYVEYHLGRKMDDFRAPSTKFLIWDAEAYNDYSHGGTATGTVVLGLDGTVAPWCADGYELAFRHLLPRDKRMYQAMGRASIAYLDGHVGILNPNLPMYKPEFFPPD
jgi:prepilin-type processing-associated H-X9-DG protein